MLVKCKIKTTLEFPIEFIFSTETLEVIEKNMSMKEIYMNFANGNFQFVFETQEICDEVYNAFAELFSSGCTVISDNISLLTL